MEELFQTAATTISANVVSEQAVQQLVHIVVDANAWVVAGINPVAVAKTASQNGAGMYIVAGTHYTFGVNHGEKLSFITV